MAEITYEGVYSQAIRNADPDYAVCHDAASGDQVGPSAPSFNMGQQWNFGSYRIWRGALCFERASIPEAGFIWVEGTKLHYTIDVIASITVAKIRLAFNNLWKTSGDYDIVVVSGADLGSPPTFPNQDNYGDLLDEIVSRGSINTAGKALNTYYDIELDATGIAEIPPTGYAKFALRTSDDINAQAPSGDSNDDFAQIYVYNHATYPIKLIVTYDGGVERAIEGTDTGNNGTAGHLWVEGTYLHYIDQNGDERRQQGYKLGATGITIGKIWIEGQNLHYIDDNGDERYLPIEGGAGAPLFDQVIFG